MGIVLFFIVLVIFVILYAVYIKRKSEASKNRNNNKTKETVNSAIKDDTFLIIKSASNLATVTVIPVESMSSKKEYPHLLSSDATKLDTVLFSCFMLRAVCISSSSNRNKAIEFSNEYVSSVINWAKELFEDCFDLEIVNSRFAFYDSIIARNCSFLDSINAIIEEFEYIIKTDIIQNKFAPFSETSPMPILGINEDMLCKIEVVSYYKSLLEYVKNRMDEAISAIQ